MLVVHTVAKLPRTQSIIKKKSTAVANYAFPKGKISGKHTRLDLDIFINVP